MGAAWPLLFHCSVLVENAVYLQNIEYWRHPMYNKKQKLSAEAALFYKEISRTIERNCHEKNRFSRSFNAILPY